MIYKYSGGIRSAYSPEQLVVNRKELLAENAELRRQVEIYKGNVEHYKELAKLNIDKYFEEHDKLAAREAELAQTKQTANEKIRELWDRMATTEGILHYRDARIAVLERDNSYLRQDKTEAQNTADSYGRQLEQADARIADMREILQDVLSDCCLSDGMRSEIEKRISGKESGK